MLCRVVTRNDPSAYTVGEAVESEILIGGEPSAGDADSHHQLPDLVIAALLALGGTVAVVALVNSVEFEERIALFVEWGAGFGEIAGDMPAKLPALLLDRLGLRNGVDLNHIAALPKAGGNNTLLDVVQINITSKTCQLPLLT